MVCYIISIAYNILSWGLYKFWLPGFITLLKTTGLPPEPAIWSQKTWNTWPLIVLMEFGDIIKHHRHRWICWIATFRRSPPYKFMYLIVWECFCW